MVCTNSEKFGLPARGIFCYLSNSSLLRILLLFPFISLILFNIPDPPSPWGRGFEVGTECSARRAEHGVETSKGLGFILFFFVGYHFIQHRSRLSFYHSCNGWKIISFNICNNINSFPQYQEFLYIL